MDLKFTYNNNDFLLIPESRKLIPNIKFDRIWKIIFASNKIMRYYYKNSYISVIFILYVVFIYF